MPNQHLYQFLEDNNISYQRIDHAAVFTSEQARKLIPKSSGASTKNLFLRDKKGKRHFLIMLDDKKELDLKSLASQLGSSRISFASPDRLIRYLKIEPGSVSILALINDQEHRVELWIDQDLWQKESIQCHPLLNTSSLIITLKDIKSFLKLTGHKINLIFL